MEDKMETLKNRPEIQKALDYLKDDDARTLAETLELCQIPAPSGAEREKALRVMEKMREIGLADVHMDAVGNVFGTIAGNGTGSRLLLAAHTDTVFPADTALTVRREGNRYFCPGINDDTRAIAEILSVARAMKALDLHGEGDIIFCANVCEEGLGDLKGVKHIFHYTEKDGTSAGEKQRLLCRASDDLWVNSAGDSQKEGTLQSGSDADNFGKAEGYDGFISVDNVVPGGIIYTATGSLRYLVTFTGTGGHSFSDFGLPNPIHAMGRAIAAIADFQVKKLPKTTFNVGVVDGGTSVNSIPGKCSMLVDLRSDSPEELRKLSERFFLAVNEAVEKENARWGCGKHYEENRKEDSGRERNSGVKGAIPEGGFAAADAGRRIEPTEGMGTDAAKIQMRAEIPEKEKCVKADRTGGESGVKATIEPKGVRPAGSQPKDAPIVRAAWDATLAAGLTPVFHDASSTDANIPISLGIPAVALGRSGDGGGTHTVHEWFEPSEAWRGPQKILLLILALSGYSDFQMYQLSRLADKENG